METSEIIRQLEQDIAFLRAPEGYIRAGHPRFFTLFGRDSLIIAWQLLDYDPNIAKHTLRVLAEFQGEKTEPTHEEEPGKIIHEWWGNITTKTPQPQPGIPWPFPYYGSIDATFLFLIVAALHFKHTNDADFIEEMKPNILHAINWMFTYATLDDDPFVEYRRKNPQGLQFQGWRDSVHPFRHKTKLAEPVELVEVQGYKYAACMLISEIVNTQYQDSSLSHKLRAEAERLQVAFLQTYRWDEERYWYYIIDGKGTPFALVTSNPGHLLFTGILPPDRADDTVQRIFKDDMWTPYGIRTESTNSPYFSPHEYQLGSVWPHDNWIIAEGMRISGYHSEYEKIKQALLRTYNEIGGIPELYAVDTNEKLIPPKQGNKIQGWSSGALLHMLTQ